MKPNRATLVLAFCALVLVGLVLLPIHGQVVVIPGTETGSQLFPQMRVEQGEQIVRLAITDNTAWSDVGVGIDGTFASPRTWQTHPGGLVTWYWEFPLATLKGTIVMYHSCHAGCVERTQFVIGADSGHSRAQLRPTKLCTVSANPERDWHGRSGWDAQITYATLADEKDQGIDELAQKVFQSTRRGLRVLVRVDYAPDQTVPPTNDQVALAQYMEYVRRLARDDRLRSVHGFIIGSGFNDPGSNSLAARSPLTPQWYARLFNGYGEDINRTDNVVQTVRAENPQVKVLVGPIRPFKMDQDAERTWKIDMPWLNYMNTTVALLDQGSRDKSQAGFALTAPDGFAVNAAGRVSATELDGRPEAAEPTFDLRRAEWDGAQVGFRIYQDWLEIINSYPTTRGLPVFINSTNTFTPDEGIPPAQNYPRGWLTSAYQVVNGEPQIHALCWFLDHDESPDGRWDGFSLSKGIGRVYGAAQEFDALLKQ